MITTPIADDGASAIELWAKAMIAAATVPSTYFMRLTRFLSGVQR
jgi:hypothetical protein